MASLQCNKPAEHSHPQKHDQHGHCFGGHVSDKIKGVFQGHGHGPAVHHPAQANCCQAPAAVHHPAKANCGQAPVAVHHPAKATCGQAPAVHHPTNANCSHGQCQPAPKKREHKNKEKGFFHKIKEAFSDDSSDSDSDCEGHKAHHKRKN